MAQDCTAALDLDRVHTKSRQKRAQGEESALLQIDVYHCLWSCCGVQTSPHIFTGALVLLALPLTHYNIKIIDTYIYCIYTPANEALGNMRESLNDRLAIILYAQLSGKAAEK